MDRFDAMASEDDWRTMDLSIRPQELDQFLQETGWTNNPALTGTAGKHGIEFYAVAIKRAFNENTLL